MLLALGRFAHDPQRILAALQRRAGVTIELFLDIDLGFREIIEFAGVAGNCASHRSQTPRTGISLVRFTILSLRLSITAV